MLTFPTILSLVYKLPMPTINILMDIMELKKTVEKMRVMSLSLDMMHYEALRDIILLTGRLEGYAVSVNDAAAILAAQAPSRGRQYVFLQGYRNALHWIFRKNCVYLDVFSPLDLHGFAYGRMLYDPEGVPVPTFGCPQERYWPGIREMWAIGAPCVTDDDMELLKALHDDFTAAMAQPGMVPLVAIAAYLYTFHGICPFGADTGFVSRLLTTMLLHMHGFTVCRYVALEGYIEANKGVYDDIAKWSKGSPDYESVIIWVDFFLTMIKNGYSEMHGRFKEAMKRPRAVRNALNIPFPDEFDKAFFLGGEPDLRHGGQGC